MKSPLITVVAAALLARAASGATIIDFSKDAAGNTLTPGTTIAEQYAAIGVHFMGSAFDEPENPSDAFASNTDMKLAASDGDVAPLAVIPADAGNFLHTYSGWFAENGDPNFAIVFDTPVTSVSIDLYDDKVGLTQMFAIEGDDILDDAQSAEIELGVQTLTVSDPGGFTVVGMILGASTDWVAADNVTFTSVPEPTSTLAAVSAFGLLRRRMR